MRPLLGLAGSFQRRHNARPTRRLRQDATVLSVRLFMDGLRGMGGQLPMLFSEPMTIAAEDRPGRPWRYCCTCGRGSRPGRGRSGNACAGRPPPCWCHRPVMWPTSRGAAPGRSDGLGLTPRRSGEGALPPGSLLLLKCLPRDGVLSCSLLAADARYPDSLPCRVVGAALVVPDECRDLSCDADRRAADQLPCAGDPEQEADDHERRDRVHRAGITRVGDHVYSLDQLDHERHREHDKKHRLSQCVPRRLMQADERQQRRRDEHQTDAGHGHRGRPDLMPGDQREQGHRSALVNAVSAADARAL